MELPSSSVTGSEEWHARPATIALPAHARTAESWLVLATFLKILQVAEWNGTALMWMVAAGSLMLISIKHILKRKIHERRFFPLIAFICSAIAIFVFSRIGI